MLGRGVKLIAINCGYYNLKVKTDDKEVIIESRVQQNDDASKYIDLDGVRYEIGEGSRDLDIRTESKVQDILTKYAILSNAEDGESVNVVVALPMGVYLNADNRNSYSQKIKNISKLKTLVNGKMKQVNINNVTVYMEGAAAMLQHKTKYDNKTVGLIDIGGNTINCAVFRNGKLQKESISQLDLGMIKLERHIIDSLNTKYGLNIQDYEITDILNHQKFKGDIQQIQDEHIDKLKQRLIEKKWNVELMEILATGGGSSDLSRSLMGKFNNMTVSKDGIYDNVRGMYIAGKVINK